jgi:hypothetical protein
MDNYQTIIDLLDAQVSNPYGDRCSYKLGYLVSLMATFADRYPEVANDLRDRLKTAGELN